MATKKASEDQVDTPRVDVPRLGEQEVTVVGVGDKAPNTFHEAVVQMNPEDTSGTEMVEVTSDVIEEFDHPGATTRKSRKLIAAAGTTTTPSAAEELGLGSQKSSSSKSSSSKSSQSSEAQA